MDYSQAPPPLARPSTIQRENRLRGTSTGNAKRFPSCDRAGLSEGHCPRPATRPSTV